MATSTLEHGDLHRKNTVTLHHHNAYSTAGSSHELILFNGQSSTSSSTMDFLLDDETGVVSSGGSGSSSESLANLLDEGLGTSLDGTDEISSSIHSSTPGLGRNDSGVFSSDETGSPNTGTGANNNVTTSTGISINLNNNNSTTTMMTISSNIDNNLVTKVTNMSQMPISAVVSTAGQTQQLPKKPRAKNSSPNRQGPQRCLVCGKVFSNASALTKHKLTHSDERKHACTMCGKAFKRQDHLNGHMLTHRNKKPFECNAKNCGKSYCDARSLRRHIESRHGHEAIATLGVNSNANNNASENKISKNNNNGKNNINHTSTSLSSNTPAPFVLGSTKGDTPSSLLDSGMVTLDPNLLDGTFDIVEVSGISSEQQHSPDEIITGGANKRLGHNLGLVKIDMDHKCGLVLGNTTSTPGIHLLTSTPNVNSNPTQTSSLSQGALGAIHIRTTQSQLHQLLTQRVSAAAAGNGNVTMSCANGSDVSKQFSGNWIASGSGNDVNKFGAATTTTTLVVTPGSLNVKCPTSTNTSPTLLKEQLELIHQIIQQAQQEENNGNSSSSIAGTIESLNSSLNGLKGSPSVVVVTAPMPQEPTVNNNANNNTSNNNITNVNTTPHKNPPKPKSKKSKANQGAATTNSTDGNENKDESTDNTGNEDKPVECTICCRRFKNTPALNGHMRLHGGYFKKDSEGKKKEQAAKESNNPPLQTASVSVRALMCEKIIQKLNIQAGGGGSSSNNIIAVEKSNGTQTATNSNTVVLTQVSSSASDQNGVGFLESSISPAALPTLTLAQSTITHGIDTLSSVDNPCSVNVVGSFQSNQNHPSSSSLSSGNVQVPSFQFVYGDEDDDNSDYLLMEQEVFNKVSSICPDSFLSGLDDSILCEGPCTTSSNNGEGTSDSTSEWNSWVATSAGVDLANSRFNSLFSTASNANDKFSTGNPFTPLPPLDPVFYQSPTPKSPSLNSQDSPSFIYPTPPASLESHNALQSPLFPFSTTTTTSSSSSCGTQPSVPTTIVFPFVNSDHGGLNNNLRQHQNSILTGGDVDMGNGSSMDMDSISHVLAEATSTNSSMTTPPITSSLFNINSINTNVFQTPSLLPTVTTPATPDTLMKHFVKTSHQGQESKRRNQKSSTITSKSSSECLNILTPSNSPTSGEESSSSVQMKVNEPSRMECLMEERGGGTKGNFLSPSCPTTTTVHKQGHNKRKHQFRNTFASNLRGNNHHQHWSHSHFTPYPILSPVRSAPGLYWTFSTRLTHVDDSKKEQPRINIGSNFQVALPQCCPDVKVKYEEVEREEVLWSTEASKHYNSENEIDKYLEFSCCSAIPGGGRNKEYALHLLSFCNGDINSAILLLMNPNPNLPAYLQDYNYCERDKWSREEISSFQDALLRHGKDFTQVCREVGTKSQEECIMFYYLWKKVCAHEYEKVRSVWKKRDSTFTLELLKNVPPPTTSSTSMTSAILATSGTSYKTHTVVDFTDVRNKVLIREAAARSNSAETSDQQQPSELASEEFPCKVCGKVFSKIKSRSAHMKSHRPPDQPSTDDKDNNNVTSVSSSKKKKQKSKAKTNLNNINISANDTNPSIISIPSTNNGGDT